MKGEEKPVLNLGVERGGQENWTDNILAKEAGMSHTTIQRIRVIENEATPEAKEQLMQGKTSISREY